MPTLTDFTMPTACDRSDHKVITDIQNVGWHIIHILEEDEQPKYSFSIGFYYQFGQPEILIIGLEFNLSHLLINDIGRHLQQGECLKEGLHYSEYIENYDICFKTVARKYYSEYFGYACWFYQNIDNFPIMQCIFPDRHGRFPWETGYTDLTTPLLYL